ncbi:MAG: hypothetical protein NTY23_09070 [Chloroflexi bacterium]|nr:hypothetical protein [Chloroflexota bacterium]
MAGFGFLHGLNEWGDLFIPIQSQFLGDPMLAFLNTVQLPGSLLPLVEDNQPHEVRVVMG